ncbi:MULTISPECIES: YkgJ family cysteine cluster protein [Pseudomonas]|uniref:YkgJ family cysteine cluster protein n=1 Tax=Pseudomonas guariconensis TaxID=1288410 RepID=UPI0020970049|nr:MULTISPECIES: YkgJ family cysteine cluster protein [Pseudomonas]MCO7597238.1 YkgJ family cysteine cluster protein [Pseudomonas guariconensis]MCU7222148.1 YkgJ family cysteine cluster protein [Pseudomonas brassicacearum]
MTTHEQIPSFWAEMPEAARASYLDPSSVPKPLPSGLARVMPWRGELLSAVLQEYVLDAAGCGGSGDGACRHYSDADKHCLIYETRPDICRVHYAQQFSWEAFVEVNVEICKLLQRQEQE